MQEVYGMSTKGKDALENTVMMFGEMLGKLEARVESLGARITELESITCAGGGVGGFALKDHESAVLNWMRRHEGEPWRQADVAEATGVPITTVQVSLRVLYAAGLIDKFGWGDYRPRKIECVTVHELAWQFAEECGKEAIAETLERLRSGRMRIK